MKSAMGARSQPLMLILTTAGFNRNVPCYGYRDVGIKVLEGVLEQDDSYYSIHTLDAGDDYHDEDNWIKSNPNLGTSVSMGFLRDEYKSAINNPSQLYNFLTKNLNIWTDSHKNWLPFDIWQLGNKGDEELEGAECYGGLDLASTRDTNSLALCFAKPDGTFSFKVFCWMPEMNVEERVKNKGINYDRWIREKWITSTPGNITDYDFIEADIVALAQKYKIKAINYDRWNSSQLVIKLIEQGLPMQAFGQGYASMSAPTKEFERLVMSEKINHFGNPVFTWHISNVSLQRDPAGNIKIDKERSSEKVDAAVSSVMSLAAWMIANGNPGQPDLNQIYKSNGIRTL
jgi:phage terminase large subunit-like protein